MGSSQLRAVLDKEGRLHSLFVYGTLKQGERLHNGYLLGAVKTGEGYIEGYDMFLMPQADYPLIVPGDGKVYGELYTVGEERLKILDQLEGGYYREEVEFFGSTDRGGNGFPVEAYVWLNRVPIGAKKIESGVFSGQALKR